MRSSNTIKDGTKRRLSYYACGNWKNKGTAVCHSNSIRADKVNEFVFKKLSELLINDKLLKDIVENINKTRNNKINPTKKELEQISKEIEKLEKRKKKIYEAYEDEIIEKEEFAVKINEFREMEHNLVKKMDELREVASDSELQQISYDLVKSIMENFDMLLNSCSTREQQKKLLHMMISEITVNESKEIDSIKLNISDCLVNYLNEQEGVSLTGTPSSFILKSLRIRTLELKMAI